MSRYITNLPINHANGCHFLHGNSCTCALERLDKLFLAARDVRNAVAKNVSLDPWLANLFTAVAALERE